VSQQNKFAIFSNFTGVNKAYLNLQLFTLL